MVSGVSALRILAISDIHERVSLLRELSTRLRKSSQNPDLVVVAGDITYFKGVNVVISILNEINRLLCTLVLFIPGNCDPPELLGIERVGQDILNLHARVVEISGYVFYGIGGGGLSPFNTLIEFAEEQFEKFIDPIRGTDPSRLLLVTHQPIYGLFDKVKSGERVGSKVFSAFLREKQPLLWITGHVHENSGWSVIGRTTVVHPGPLMRGYYAIVELDDQVKSVSINKL